MMDYETENLIFRIKQKSLLLVEAADALEKDVCSNPFDIDDARLCFQEVCEIVEELKILLDDTFDD